MNQAHLKIYFLYSIHTISIKNPRWFVEPVYFTNFAMWRQFWQRVIKRNFFAHFPETEINIKYTYSRRTPHSLKSKLKCVHKSFKNYSTYFILSLVANRFGRVEFWILNLNIWCYFPQVGAVKKSNKNIQNSTRPNRWATKDINIFT